MKSAYFISALLFLISGAAQAHSETQSRFIQVSAKTRTERTLVSELGMSIEAVRSDSVWGFASPSVIERLEKTDLKILGNFAPEIGRGGHEGLLDFPSNDSKFHNYAEMVTALRLIQSRHADIARIGSIGKSAEGREIWAIHINTTPESLMAGSSNKPGAVYMGAHHAREHVSSEIPRRLAEYLLDNRSDPKIWALLDNRDIWIIPMVNPDGAEFDISTGRYKYWRKNRAKNVDSTFGVDLNRNYGFQWGTGGSSNDPSSDVYMGTKPFSEPETQVIRDFVSSHLNLKMLLTFHTFSELILYPWGHTYDKVGVKLGSPKDYQVFKKMAETMAQWNHYTPQQSSDLYIASGDTCDWAYGTHGIFAFTFELSPSGSAGAGGFYPGQSILDRVFNDNIKPALYMLENSDDPYKVIGNQPNRHLKSLIDPQIPSLFQ